MAVLCIIGILFYFVFYFIMYCLTLPTTLARSVRGREAAARPSDAPAEAGPRGGGRGALPLEIAHGQLAVKVVAAARVVRRRLVAAAEAL